MLNCVLARVRRTTIVVAPCISSLVGVGLTKSPANEACTSYRPEMAAAKDATSRAERWAHFERSPHPLPTAPVVAYLPTLSPCSTSLDVNRIDVSRRAKSTASRGRARITH